MGNPGDSETIQDFIVENDSCAVAMINLTKQNNEQSVVIVNLDPSLNIIKSRRYFESGFSIFGHGFSNRSNNKIATSFSTFDYINFKANTTITLFDSNYDTISALRFYHTMESYYGFTPIFLDNDTLHGLISFDDSALYKQNHLVKIDLIGKTIVSYKEIRFAPNKLFIVSDISTDTVQDVIGLGAIVSTDSTFNFYNPLFFTINMMHEIQNTLMNDDTLNVDSKPDIKQAGNSEYLLGYSRNTSGSPISEYYITKTDINLNLGFQKLIPNGFSSFVYAKTLDALNKEIVLLSGRTIIRFDSTGNILSSNFNITNTQSPFSRGVLSKYTKWLNDYLIVGSYELSTNNFEALFIKTDSNFISCDNIPLNVNSVNTNVSFYNPSIQISDINPQLTIVSETYSIDSTNFPLTSYCSFIGLEEFRDKSGYTIFPNPFNNAITILSKNDNESFNNMNKLEIYDLTGRILRSENLLSNSQFLNLQELQAGIYLIRITNESNIIQTNKLVKK